MTSNQNKSPVVHVEHNLGLESWCVKRIYEYAHTAVLASRKQCRKQYCNPADLLKYLNVTVLINPDVATFWNLRRGLVEKNQLNLIKEFQFSSIALSIKPKCNEAFAYRRWLYLFQSEESNDWSIELGLCERCADKNTSNYHAWSHRQWVLDKASHLLKFEMYKTEKYIRKHVYDYSCYHHRQHVLRTLYDYNYFEPEEVHHKEIVDLTNVILLKHSKAVTTQAELVSCLLPTHQPDRLNDTKLRSFLYCINYAASDIKFCEELKFMFGESTAFEAHHRAMVLFIVDTIRHANSTTDMTTDCWQPSSKLIKVEAGAENGDFLTGLKALEAKRGAQHRKWCATFLGFQFDDEDESMAAQSSDVAN